MTYKFIPTPDIPKYRQLFPNLLHTRLARLYAAVLNRFGTVIGQTLYWRLPQHYTSLANNFDTQRAVRITNRLLQTGYLSSAQLVEGKFSDEPPSFMSVVQFPHNKKASGWQGSYVHLFDPSRTYWPALGEAIERLCLLHPHYTPRETIQSSYKNLQKPKVDIFDLAGFTTQERQKSSSQNNNSYDADSRFMWLPCTELTHQTTIYAPLQWFSFSHVMAVLTDRSSTAAREAMLTAPITTGAAAGQTQDDAILTGLFEVIERDAFMIYWLNQIPAKRINLQTIKNEELQQLMTIAADYRLEVHALYLQTDVPVHTIGLVLLDRTGVGPAVMVTAKTGWHIDAILISLLHESLGRRSKARTTYTEVKKENKTLHPDKLGHTDRMLYWYNPKQIEKIEPFISGELVAHTNLPSYKATGSAKDDLQQLITWFHTHDYQILYRELISPKLKNLTEDMSVVMVKVPKLQPLYLEEWLRSTHGARLRDIPEQLGYPRPKDKDDPFHREPHPFP